MTILEIKNLFVDYTRTDNTQKSSIHAVNGISLELNKGEILSIAGESGCGKSTLAKAIMKLVPIKSGEIILNNQNQNDTKDYYKKVQMIFQNPYSSLNPKMKIGQILTEPLEINTKLSKNEIGPYLFLK